MRVVSATRLDVVLEELEDVPDELRQHWHQPARNTGSNPEHSVAVCDVLQQAGVFSPKTRNLIEWHGTSHLSAPRIAWHKTSDIRDRADKGSVACIPAKALSKRVRLRRMINTAASLAISAGANVKAVQKMLGHASAAMTLDVYADLFDDDLDAVGNALSAVGAPEVVGKMWARSDTDPETVIPIKKKS